MRSATFHCAQSQPEAHAATGAEALEVWVAGRPVFAVEVVSLGDASWAKAALYKATERSRLQNGVTGGRSGGLSGTCSAPQTYQNARWQISADGPYSCDAAGASTSSQQGGLASGERVG
jgi:hypothetical protein